MQERRWCDINVRASSGAYVNGWMNSHLRGFFESYIGEGQTRKSLELRILVSKNIQVF